MEMNDPDMLKNLIQLFGANDAKVKKVITLVDILGKIRSNGADKNVAIKLASQINPKITPLIKILENDKEERKEEPFVQYNRPQ